MSSLIDALLSAARDLVRMTADAALREISQRLAATIVEVFEAAMLRIRAAI